MKRFWSLYMLFFTIPFPMILYYSIHGDMNKEPSTNQLVALCLLGISVILWGTILYRYFQKWVRTPFRIQSAISQLLRNGTRREAKIMDVVQLKPASPDVETFEIQVEMENFNGTTISQRLQINDSRPEDKRYEVGKTIRLRIDETLESRPFIIPESIQLTIKHSKVALLVLCWLLLVLAVAGYYAFSYWYESSGSGWRFLTFWHPLVLCAVILLFTQDGISSLLKLFVGDPEKYLRLKYHGKKTMAEVVSAKQTGTYINEQPQVQFDLNYEDSRGQRHRVSMKTIVSLLNLDMAKQKEIEIFYLEDDPQKIAFVNDAL